MNFDLDSASGLSVAADINVLVLLVEELLLSVKLIPLLLRDCGRPRLS